jgi:hypothetical protein
MEIRDFDNVRVGSGFPASFDIRKIQYHESYGVYATAFVSKDQRIELRKNKNGDEIALFNFKNNDLDLPCGWEDSEVLWANIK